MDVAALSVSSRLSRRCFCATCQVTCRQRAVCEVNPRSHFRSWTARWALFLWKSTTGAHIARQRHYHRSVGKQAALYQECPIRLRQLDLLLLTVARARKVHADGIRYQGLRYVDTTLAAYVGESVALRYDPRDMAEIRVFHQERFVCRAICPELAGETVPLKEILRARNRRRRELRTILRDRKKVVDALLEVKRSNGIPAEEAIQTVEHEKRQPALKRYMNE